MRPALVFALLLTAARAFAGPPGAEDPHAASATGFPGVYLGSVSLALEEDAGYGSRLLDALDAHLQAIGVMTGPREVLDYLEQSAGGSEGVNSLRQALGREPLEPTKASALLLADALARPKQFLEVLDGLEALKRGFGRHAAEVLRGARGVGDKRLLAALREAGGKKRGATPSPYATAGRLAPLFDGPSTDGQDGVVLDAADAAADRGAAGRARASNVPRPARP